MGITINLATYGAQELYFTFCCAVILPFVSISVMNFNVKYAIQIYIYIYNEITIYSDGKDNAEILKSVKRGVYEFDPRHWKYISPKAIDLINKLLCYDPRKRIKASQALNHPWITLNSPQSSIAPEIPQRYINELLKRFRQFHHFNKMKQMALTCIAYNLTDLEIGNLATTFSALDKNGDGVLTTKVCAF